jgi:hypothetical protein
LVIRSFLRALCRLLSTAQVDYVKQGFLAASRAEERKCAGMQAEVLETITDVTPKINAASAGKSGQVFVGARDAGITAAESAGCGKDEHHRCQVVSLYRGGQ